MDVEPHTDVIPDSHIVARPVKRFSLSQARVFLTGGRYVVQTSDGTVVSKHRVSDNILAEIPWQSHRHLPGTSMLLGNSAGAACYYHWMLDILPKLAVLQRTGIQLDQIDHFLVREISSSFQRETLHHFGIDENRIVETAKQPYLQCDEIHWVPLDHRINMTMHAFVPKWLRDTFSTPCETSTVKEPIKLYVTRPKGVRRGISNEDELMPLLKSYGYHVVAMEGLSIQEQAQLLARTDVLIAAHGGALSNMVFAPAGITVLELFGRHVYPYYYGLANLCQHKYNAILENQNDYAQLVRLDAALKQGAASIQLQTQVQNFVVNPERFELALQKLA